MKRLVAAFLVPLLLASSCGDEATEGAGGPAGRGRWRHARLEGLRGASGIAALEGHLLVAAGPERAVFDVLFEPAEVENGTTLKARRIPLVVDEGSILRGGDAFAAQGYRLGDLWSQPVDFQGIAVQAPDFVFLAERTYRVAYAGRMLQTPEREWRALRIDRAFVLPGAERSRSEASDWRDQGPGVAGLAAVGRFPRTEDLYAIERSAEAAGTLHVHALDRYGLVLGAFRVDLGADGRAGAVGGFLRAERRFLVVRGSDRGLIHPVRPGRWKSTVRAGRGVPGPEVEGAGPWSGMAEGPDGAIVLVSGGETPYVAWRTP